MGLIASCLSCFRPAEREAPPAALGAADDTVFDPALLQVDGEALRAEAHALGDAAHATSAASQQAYQSGDGAGAKQLSLQANAKRAAAAAKNEEAARAIFAQKNNGRGLWEVDLHLLLVAEALERVKRRLQACSASAAAEGASSKELVVIYGQGHHSSNGVAKIKPAVLQLLADGGWQTQEGVPNAGAQCTHTPELWQPCSCAHCVVARRLRYSARYGCTPACATVSFAHLDGAEMVYAFSLCTWYSVLVYALYGVAAPAATSAVVTPAHTPMKPMALARSALGW